MSTTSTSDSLPVVIIGAGLAGLTVALELAETRQVIIMAKRGLSESATAWAQGGIVGVIDQQDSVDAHVRDTVEAGAGLVVESTARYIAERSADAIDWLVTQGVPFTTDPAGPKGLHLTREGGHSHRRIAHAADATGKAVAIREGHAFADTIFGNAPRATDHALVASAVFTRPEFGTCGLSEDDARKLGPVEVYASAFRPMRSSFAGADERVLMKLVVSKESRVVLGCHIVAPEAGEMIQLAAIAMKMGATKEQFDATCAVHPTMAEELVTMRAPVRHA